MLAAPLARWLADRGIHYGWVMVALTFLTALCSAAAVGMPGANAFRVAVNTETDPAQVKAAITRLFTGDVALREAA